MTKKISLEDALILKVARTARFLVHVLPLQWSLFVGRRIGALIYYSVKRSNIAYKNMRAAYNGELSRSQMKRIVKHSIQNLTMSAVELLRFPDLDKEYIKENIEFAGLEKFEPYLKRGTGVIFLTAHFGNWELLNVTGGVLGYPMAVLARVQKHPRSDEFLNSLRASKGSLVVYKGMNVRELLRALKNGGIVGMLSDQDGGKRGTFVNFFNRLSSTPSGVATFALRTGAPIFPVFNFRQARVENSGTKDWKKHRIEVEGPLVPPPDTSSPEEAERFILQQFAQMLESKIRKSPSQWLWTHRRWKSTPDRSVIILSDGKSGHLNQSLAVLRAIKEERAAQGYPAEKVHSKIIEVHFKSKFHESFLKTIAYILAGHLPFKQTLMKCLLEPRSHKAIQDSYADVVVSCGHSLLGINLMVSKENGAKSVVVMRPSFSGRSFDVVIVPKHDKMKKAKNVFVTERALSLIDHDYLKAEAEKLGGELALSGNRRMIGFLVGGDTGSIKFSKDFFEKALGDLLRYAKETQSLVLATSSRRTPLWADELLKKTLGDPGLCPLLVIANESNKKGVVGGILGLCDALLVSGESVSMVSEAVSSGKPVVVFSPWENGRVKPKYREFLERMERDKLIVPALSGNIYEAISRHAATDGKARQGVAEDREVLREAVKRVF